MALGNADHEKRSAKRIRLSDGVHFHGKDAKLFGDCLSRDISEGGIQILVNEFIPLKSLLVIEINLNGKQIVECLTKVVRIEKHSHMDRYVAGLQFMETDTKAFPKKEIYQFIKSQQQT